MISKIGFSYNTDDLVRKLTDEQYERLRTGVAQLDLPEDRTQYRSYQLGGESRLIDMETDGRLLAELGIPFEVKAFKGTVAVASQVGPPGATINIAIPNIGLVQINEVMVLEDACTDDLQSHLDEGWRILCVCPPNNQRRPDYILGRTKGG